MTEKEKTRMINGELRRMEFNLQKDLRCFFIDNEINIRSE